MPGQTRRSAVTIAPSRILQWRAGQLPGQTELDLPGVAGRRSPSMEGRTIARPDWHHGCSEQFVIAPSMEGRTIARPDETGLVPGHNGADCLQWRAGQLPGQTMIPAMIASLTVTFNGGPDNCPARPGWTPHWRCGRRAFNGGPDNCPARQAAISVYAARLEALQWRAGQLPGQTPARPGW